MQILVRWLLNALVIVVAAYILPGVAVSGFVVALLIAVVLGLLNAVIKPLLVILTLPINIVTLGLFTLVINAFLIWLTSIIIPGFSVSGFGYAILFGIVLSIVGYIVNRIFNK